MNIVHINMTGGYCNILKLVLCVILCNCGYKMPMGSPLPTTKGYNLFNEAPDGPPAFQYGWTQGCSSATSAWASQFYSMTGSEKFQKDFEYANKYPDYELAWQMSFWYCLRIAEKYEGFKKDKYAGYTVF